MKRNYSETEEIFKYIVNRLKEYGSSPKAVTATSLCVEEILHGYSEIATPDTPVYFEVHRNSRELAVIVSISGEDGSLEQSTNDFSILDNLIKNVNFQFSHKYADGINTDCLVIEKYSHVLDDLKFSFQHLGKNKTNLIGGLATHIISIAANLIIPYLTGVLVVAYTDNAIKQVIFVAIAITISRCINGVFMRVTNILYCRTSFGLQHSIRRKLMGELFLVQDETLDEKGDGPFITMLSSDVKIISSGLTTIANYISDGMYYIGAFIAIFLIDKVAFLIGLLLMSVLFILEKIRAYYLDIDMRKSYVTEDRLSAMVFNLVNCVKEVKNQHAEENVGIRYIIADRENIRNDDQLNTRTQILSAVNKVVMYVAFGLVMIYLGQAIYTHRMEPAYALVLFNYFTILGIPVITFIEDVIGFNKEYELACERVRNFLNGSEYSKEIFGKITSKKINGEISFQDVSFTYNYNNPLETDKTVLKGFNLTIHPGEKVALVGASGCGKSTALKLVNRQRDCTGGMVTLDGINTIEYSKDMLRGNISMVSQFPDVFYATVKENLLFVKPDASMEELENACRKACILDDIQNMSKGFDTELGKKATRLSGGQAQRLAIARVFLRDTPIILLDEATSALDNVTQKKIMDNIMQSNKTVLFVAHRLSTIRDADQIAVLSEGKIIAKGTHEELMHSCEIYKRLYQSDISL